MNNFFRTLVASTLVLLTVVTAGILPLSSSHASAQQRQNIRVGVYDNYPKIYRDETGAIRGFWADVTNAIAKKENWNVTYVYGTFSQGLQRLKDHQIDMMVDVGVSPERQQIFDFENTDVISGWATVYSRNGFTVNGFTDLSGKKVAVMKSDIHYTGPNGIKNTLASLGIPVTFVETGSYDGVFRLLDSGQADAGVVNGEFGAINEHKYSVLRTGILFDPIELKYALPKGAAKNTYLISTLDSNLIEMKQDPQSVYYKALDQSLGAYSQAIQTIPKWVYVTVIVGGALLAGSVIVVTLMREYQKHLKREIQKRIGQIKDNEEKYSAVVNQAQDAIAIIQDEKIIFANKAINVIGYPEKEIIGKRIADLIAPPERKKVVGFYHSRISGDTTAPMYETKLMHKDGSLVDVEISSGVINYGGEPAGVVMVRDITQRKKMEADLQLQNTILSAELEVSINGVLVVDKIGNVILYNQRFVDLWQVPKEALATGNHRSVLNSVIHQTKDPQAFLAKVEDLYAHKSKKDHTEVQLVDGRVMDRYTAPMYVGKKEYVGRVWFFQDVTERKQQTEKMAQLERAKHEFVSIAAHQLRAPVTAIMNASNIMRDFDSDNLTLSQKQFVNMIIKGADQMNELVDFLLTMTRAEAGSMTLVPTPVKLERLTKDLIKELGSTLNMKSMKIKISKQPDKLPPVFVDKNAMTQVILNLLTNAIDYSPEGSNIAVSIVLNENFVEFSVQDEGIGIAAADREKIFDKFYRSEQAKEAVETGTGLGLSLAKSIVESWGGKIWVESGEDKGSTFYFTVPIAEVQAATAKANKVLRPAAETSKAA